MQFYINFSSFQQQTRMSAVYVHLSTVETHFIDMDGVAEWKMKRKEKQQRLFIIFCVGDENYDKNLLLFILH